MPTEIAHISHTLDLPGLAIYHALFHLILITDKRYCSYLSLDRLQLKLGIFNFYKNFMDF